MSAVSGRLEVPGKNRLLVDAIVGEEAICRLRVGPVLAGERDAPAGVGRIGLVDFDVVDLTNLSGTFQFDDENELRDVAAELRRQGLTVEQGAVRFFPLDGSRPVTLE
jgi:hypothetical protein